MALSEQTIKQIEAQFSNPDFNTFIVEYGYMGNTHRYTKTFYSLQAAVTFASELNSDFLVLTGCKTCVIRDCM